VNVIMRNSVILVDRVQKKIAEDRDAWSAVVDAAVHGTRPVFPPPPGP
jgi:multidrug efflux pump subunit AcrB